MPVFGETAIIASAEQIAAGIITGEKIASATITDDKLASNVAPFVYMPTTARNSGAIASSTSADGAVIFSSLAAGVDYIAAGVKLSATPSAVGAWTNQTQGYDDDYSTVASRTAVLNDEIRLDFGSVLSNILVVCMPGTLTGTAVFEYSANGTDWTDSGAGNLVANDAVFLEAASARYARFRCTVGGAVQLRELIGLAAGYKISSNSNIKIFRSAGSTIYIVSGAGAGNLGDFIYEGT